MRTTHIGLALGLGVALTAIAGAAAAQERGPVSHEAVEAKIAEIRVDDVAWRQIPWKTCILDGLATAQREDKPIMFWCHIDRPVDDTRC